MINKEDDIVEALYHISKLEKSMSILYTEIEMDRSERLHLKLALKRYKSLLKKELGVKK